MAQAECKVPGNPESWQLAPVDWSSQPSSWLLCIIVGMAISTLALWPRLHPKVRVAVFITGQVVALTVPIFAHLDQYVVGQFPTVDKMGSLAFYLDGVHIRMLTQPADSLNDPAARLIGVHMGHLWLTQLFDLWMTPEGAMNLQGMLYPIMAWGCAALLFREAGSSRDWAVLMAFPFGMTHHLFRDLNCYTIEKSAIFWIPLFCWTLLKSHRQGGCWSIWAGMVYLLMSWMNLYLGAIGALLGATLGAPVIIQWARQLIRKQLKPVPGLVWALFACALLSFPLMAWQHALSVGESALGSPAMFRERAVADSVTLAPLEWNRMSWWSALSPIGVALGTVGLWKSERTGLRDTALLGAATLAALSLGPEIQLGLVTPWINPVDLLAREAIPGFWRSAKPEVFFYGSWLLFLGCGAVGLSRNNPPRWVTPCLYLLMIGTWLVLVRQHSEYPHMSHKTEVKLPAGWEQNVFVHQSEGGS